MEQLIFYILIDNRGYYLDVYGDNKGKSFMPLSSVEMKRQTRPSFHHVFASFAKFLAPRLLSHIDFCSNDNLPILADTTVMFVEGEVSYSVLLTFLVEWHTSGVSFPLGDVIFAQLACPLNEVIFCLHLE
jgi:hypothetical protein